MRHLLVFVRLVLTLSVLCVMQASAFADILQAGQTTYSNVFVESLQRDDSGAKVYMVRFEDRSLSPVAADRVTRIVFGDDDEGRVADIQIGTSRFHDTHAGVRLLYLAGGTLTVVPKGTTETKDYALSEVVSFTAEKPVEAAPLPPAEEEEEAGSTYSENSSNPPVISDPPRRMEGRTQALGLIYTVYVIILSLGLFWFMLVEGQYFWILVLFVLGSCFPVRILFLLFQYEGPHKGKFLTLSIVEPIALFLWIFVGRLV